MKIASHFSGWVTIFQMYSLFTLSYRCVELGHSPAALLDNVAMPYFLPYPGSNAIHEIDAYTLQVNQMVYQEGQGSVRGLGQTRLV
jgi:hypothetical protein